MIDKRPIDFKFKELFRPNNVLGHNMINLGAM